MVKKKTETGKNLPRRSFLGALGVFGAAAAGGPLLGQSLWLRSDAAADQDPKRLTQPTTLTVGNRRTLTYTMTTPGTYSESGTVSNPSNGTYTESGKPFPTETYTQTGGFPGPQTITIGHTLSFSATPRGTVSNTWSWSGSSYSYSASRSPTYFTVTVSDSYTATYTSTTPAQQQSGGQQPFMASTKQVKAPAVIQTIDSESWDPTDPVTRGGRMRAAAFRS